MRAADLGFRTEPIVLRVGGEIERRGGFTVVRTPPNPTFFWGNCLVFDDAPRAGDGERWPQLFARHITELQPASRHWAFGWLADELGEIAPLLAQGCTLIESMVMTADKVKACAPHPGRTASAARCGLAGAARTSGAGARARASVRGLLRVQAASDRALARDG